jgi:probable rRNA maturation factor
MKKTARGQVRRRAAPFKIDAVIEDERWRSDAHALRLMRRAMRGGLAAPYASTGKPVPATALTLLLADDARLKSLNHDFRGKNTPTNVLSFPSSVPGYLGDIAIAYPTVAKEARAQKKRFADHAAHLALHGILHLIGYDHETAMQADAMESLEIAILAQLGIASPYRPRAPKALTRAKKAA